MEDDRRSESVKRPFEQDHENMRAAATNAVQGPAASESVPSDRPRVHEPIPGERDRSTLTTRQPGAVSGQFSGGDIPSADHLDWIDEATADERINEGGGADASRSKRR